MDNNSAAWIAIAIAISVITALAFVVYPWRQRDRVIRIKKWVHAFLCERYGESAKSVVIHCSNDTLWPVLVEFQPPGSEIRKRLQFSCGWAKATFTLLPDKAEAI